MAFVRSIVGLWMLCLLSFSVRSETPLQDIERCFERLPQPEALTEICPQLPIALAELTAGDVEWSVRLAELYGDDAVSFLQAVRDGVRTRSTTNRVLDPDSARGEVAKLNAEASAQVPGLWARFVAWVKNLSGQGDENSATPDWLQRLLDSVTVTESVGETIFWISSALIVLMAIAFIVSEVRVRRSPKSSAARHRAQGVRSEASAASHDRDIDQLATIDICERPAAMLRIAVAHLQSTGALQKDDSLTNRELAQQLGSRTLRWFVGLSSLADAVIFGEHRPSNEQLDKAKHALRRLLKEST